MSDEITIYTDGACSGNPGPGGWGFVLESGGNVKELSGGEPETTNGVANVLSITTLTRRSRVKLYTDSTYVRNGITTWIHNWKKRGWKTSSKKPVKNEDLWRELDAAAQEQDIEWVWVKAHTGNPGNERADELARQGIDEVR